MLTTPEPADMSLIVKQTNFGVQSTHSYEPYQAHGVWHGVAITKKNTLKAISQPYTVVNTYVTSMQHFVITC